MLISGFHTSSVESFKVGSRSPRPFEGRTKGAREISRAVLTKKQNTVPQRPARVTLSWQTLADPAVFERMHARAEWLASHVQYLRSMVPLPIDGDPPTPLTMVEPKTFYA